MISTSGPLQYDDVHHLLDYIIYHSWNPRMPEFRVSLAIVSDPAAPAAYTIPVADVSYVPHSCSTVITVEGLAALKDLFNYPSSLTIQTIDWVGVRNCSVHIDVPRRQVHLRTDSISFVELCRHKLSRSGVHRMSVDLSVR